MSANSSVVGARFSDHTSPKHIITHYVSIEILDESILRLEKSIEILNKKFNHIQSIIGEPFLQTIIKNYLDELEQIFDNETYKKNKMQEFLDQFEPEELQKYLVEKNAKT